MAVAFVKNHPVASNKVAGTTLDVTLDTDVPADNLIVARVLFDNASVASKPLISSISRAAGETNSWQVGGSALSTSTSAGAFASGQLYTILTSVVWPAASYTVTLDTSVTQKAGFFQEFSGVQATGGSVTRGFAYSTTTTAASAVTTGVPGPTSGGLMLGFIFGSNVAAAQAGDNDTLDGSWSTPVGVGSTGGSGTTNNYGVGQYKIVTGTSHQTLNNSAAMTAGNGAIIVYRVAYVPPAVTQAAYRFYADGTETGSTALASQDTGYTADTSAGDVNLQIRTRLQSTTAIAVPATDDWQLQWEKNTSGTWNNVSVGGTVNTYNSPNLTDGEATTNRLGAGTGSFVAGKVSEDGLVDNVGWSAANYTEVLYSVTLKQADLTPTDTLKFRILRNGATTGLTYTQVPTITIGAGGPTDRTGTATGSLSLSGAASGVPEVAGTATGSLSVVGVAAGSPSTPGVEVTGTAAGSLTISGVASGVPGVSGAATGALAVTGTAAGQKSVTATATGSLTISGVVAGVAGVTATATGALALTGTALGVPGVLGVASSSLSLAGTAAGIVTKDVTGVATGALTITGTAAGIPTVTATATGSLAISGVAAGTPGVTATATGSLTVVGTATGVRGTPGTATGQLSIGGTATATKQVTATATGQLVLGSQALGLVEGNAVGTATGALTIAGTATGARSTVATATGQVSITAGAAGVRGTTATASGVLTVVALAVAIKTIRGTATGQITITGTATGSGLTVSSIIGEWNDQDVVAMQYGADAVVEWFMLTATATAKWDEAVWDDAVWASEPALLKET